MKITKPPQDITARVSAETGDGLKLYQQYQKDALGMKWKQEEMIGAILSAFLVEGDTDFSVWRKRQRTEEKRGIAVEPNGATHA